MHSRQPRGPDFRRNVTPFTLEQKLISKEFIPCPRKNPSRRSTKTRPTAGSSSCCCQGRHRLPPELSSSAAATTLRARQLQLPHLPVQAARARVQAAPRVQLPRARPPRPHPVPRVQARRRRAQARRRPRARPVGLPRLPPARRPVRRRVRRRIHPTPVR